MKIQLRSLLLVSFMFLALYSQGQIKFGVRGGLNLANMSGSDIYNDGQTIKPCFHLGGFVEHSLSKVFSVETGLLLSEKGTKFKAPIFHSGVISDGEITLNPIYLEIPINAVYNMQIGNSKLFFCVGPYIGVGVAGKIKEEYLEGEKKVVENFKFDYDDSSYAKRIDSGLNFGVGIEYNKFQIRAQYGLGLLNIAPKDGMMKNYVVGISLGYMLSQK